MDKPTCEELAERAGVKSVRREADDSWRHGAYVTEVFSRESDGTFWRAVYRLSSDGETDELAEGLAEIDQVHAETKTVTVYV